MYLYSIYVNALLFEAQYVSVTMELYSLFFFLSRVWDSGSGRRRVNQQYGAKQKEVTGQERQIFTACWKSHWTLVSFLGTGSYRRKLLSLCRQLWAHSRARPVSWETMETPHRAGSDTVI